MKIQIQKYITWKKTQLVFSKKHANIEQMSILFGYVHP